MKIIKTILLQAMMISYGILAEIGISVAITHLMGGESMTLEWYHPLSFVLCGLLGAIPTYIWRNMESLTKRQFAVRLILHCLVLYAIVMLFGYVFKWYTMPDGFIAVSVGFFIVYAFVWVATYFFYRQEDKAINAAIDKIRDEE